MTTSSVIPDKRLRLSASSLTTFDNDTGFGCKRKWWFKYVLKLPDPPGPGAELGGQLHKAIEKNLAIDERLVPAREFIAEVHAGGWHLEVELKDDKLLPGFDFIGYIDAINPEKKIIRDWKTMKTLQYAKPSMMLEKDLQMNLYAAAVADTDEDITIEHISITTQKPYQVLRTAAVSTPEIRQAAVQKALALGAGMQQYMSITDVKDTEPDRSKCGLCPYKNNCPTGEKTMNLLSSILNAKPAAAPASATPVVPTGILPPEAPRTMQGTMLGQPVNITLPPVPAEPFQAVPPPRKTPPMPIPGRRLVIQEIPTEAVEAPAPTNKLEQLIRQPSEVALPPPGVVYVDSVNPVTGAVTATEAAPAEAPKKRGRPPGSKSTKAADTLPPGSTGTGGIAQAIQNHIKTDAQGNQTYYGVPLDQLRPEPTPASLIVKSITVTRSATVQVSQYEPMRVDVSVTADVAGLSVAEATHLLDQQVMSELVRRMEHLHEAKRDMGVLKAQGK